MGISRWSRGRLPVAGLLGLTLLTGACGTEGHEESSKTVVIPEVIVSGAAAESTAPETVKLAAQLIERRVETATGFPADVTVEGHRLTVRADGEGDAVVAAVETVGELRFRPVIDMVGPGEELALTRPDDDEPDKEVALAEEDGAARYRLGPAELHGPVVEKAEAILDDQGGQGWVISLVLGQDAIETFNRIARLCFNTAPACPMRQLAIVVDSQVISAPSIQVPEFERDLIQISGNFTEPEAKALAVALGTGPLPLEVDVVDVVDVDVNG